MARLATMHCTHCDDPVGTQTIDQVVDRVLGMEAGTRVLVLAPIESKADREIVFNDAFFDDLKSQGYVRIRIDQQTYDIDKRPPLTDRLRHQVEVVVDRVKIDGRDRSRIAESIEAAMHLGGGFIRLAIHDDQRPEPQWQVQSHSLALAVIDVAFLFNRSRRTVSRSILRSAGAVTAKDWGVRLGMNRPLCLTCPNRWPRVPCDFGLRLMRPSVVTC